MLSRNLLMFGQAPPFYPTNFLGGKLRAMWDFERSDLIATSGGVIVTATDVAAGYAPTQGTGSARPTHRVSPTTGRLVATPDGGDDQLTLGSIPGNIPTGATPFEVWVIWNQIALAADTGSRWAIGWGGSTSAFVTFAFGRTVVSGVNRATLFIGTGAATQVSNLNVDFSGRCVIRGVLTGTEARVDVDGNAGTPVAAVPTIANTSRVRLFANGLNTPGGFASGDISAIAITSLLDSAEAANMYSFCNPRA